MLLSLWKKKNKISITNSISRSVTRHFSCISVRKSLGKDYGTRCTYLHKLFSLYNFFHMFNSMELYLFCTKVFSPGLVYLQLPNYGFLNNIKSGDCSKAFTAFNVLRIYD